jgi:hypothetical protein
MVVILSAAKNLLLPLNLLVALPLQLPELGGGFSLRTRAAKPSGL